MYYELRGPVGAPPLLVLHGGGSLLNGMDAQAKFFSNEFRVIVPEQIGHGRTNDAPRAYTYDDMADDTVALLDVLGVTAPAKCVGFSDGGIVCLDLAMRHPERIDRVAVSGANFRPEGMNDEMLAWARHARGRELVPRAPQVGEKVLAMWLHQPTWTAADLARIPAPVLVLAGERDVIRPEHTRALAAAMPRAQLRIIAGATHDVPSEKPDLFNKTVNDFFHQGP
jgi:pimeloyl-ACP methyl ester carboxylesterase